MASALIMCPIDNNQIMGIRDVDQRATDKFTTEIEKKTGIFSSNNFHFVLFFIPLYIIVLYNTVLLFDYVPYIQGHYLNRRNRQKNANGITKRTGNVGLKMHLDKQK